MPVKIKAHKIRLELNNEQTTLARKHSGTRRLAWNWGLAKCIAAYELDKTFLTAIDLHKMWVAEFKSENEWTYEISKCAPQQAFRDLETAFLRFFKMPAVGYPKFKKKGLSKDSFCLEGKIQTNGRDKIKLPKFGWLKCSEFLPELADGQYIKNVVVSRRADHWFVSFKLEFTPLVPLAKSGVVGVDLGIRALATLSDGTSYANRHPFKKRKRQLKLAQRKASKKLKRGQREQSRNYYKANEKVARIHYQIGCERADSIHQLTSYLAKNHSEIVIEDLNIKGMSACHNLASAILDGGFFEFRRQLTYKCEWYGTTLIIADRFFASSKTCSECGVKKDKLSLAERNFHCEACNFKLDRDLNAALNLRNYAASNAVNACGGPKQPKAVRLRGPKKQEANDNSTNG